MPSLKAFKDDNTLMMIRNPAVQNKYTFNTLLGWCRMAFKPAKSRSLVVVKGNLQRCLVCYSGATVSEEQVKRKFKAQDEIDKSVSELKFEDM